jgi:hypothetical protein
LTVLAVSVNVMTQAVALGGDFGNAASLVAEADTVTEATGTRVAPYGALVLAGLQGREADASGLLGAPELFVAVWAMIELLEAESGDQLTPGAFQGVAELRP